MLPGPMGAASAAGESPFVPQGNRSPVVDAPNADLERALNAPADGLSATGPRRTFLRFLRLEGISGKNER
jgi:hypothetical protein